MNGIVTETSPEAGFKVLVHDHELAARPGLLQKLQVGIQRFGAALLKDHQPAVLPIAQWRNADKQVRVTILAAKLLGRGASVGALGNRACRQLSPLVLDVRNDRAKLSALR